MPRGKSWLQILSGLNMWLGMPFGSWLDLLSKNRFSVERGQTSRILITTGASVLNSIDGFFEKIFYGDDVARTELVAPPIFIVGYWRTGTTHLHNLLCQGERFTYPTTYTCMFPHHFLLTERVVKQLLSRVVPETRPMDRMPLTWDSPQEDEVALALLGEVSPYRDFAYPDGPETYHRFLDFNDATDSERELFKQLILYIMRKHTLRSRKRIVLKSPAHTYRIRLLVEALPGAKFIHIYRDPVTVFVSALHMFTIIRSQVGLTRADNSRLEQRIIDDMLLCYRRVWEDRAILAPDQFHEVRFEDLEKQPITELEKIYRKLRLGGFELVRPKVEAYLASISDYRKNVYEIPAEKRRQLAAKLAPILEAYGYTEDAVD